MLNYLDVANWGGYTQQISSSQLTRMWVTTHRDNTGAENMVQAKLFTYISL